MVGGSLQATPKESQSLAPSKLETCSDPFATVIEKTYPTQIPSWFAPKTNGAVMTGIAGTTHTKQADQPIRDAPNPGARRQDSRTSARAASKFVRDRVGSKDTTVTRPVLPPLLRPPLLLTLSGSCLAAETPQKIDFPLNRDSLAPPLARPPARPPSGANPSELVVAPRHEVDGTGANSRVWW